LPSVSTREGVQPALTAEIGVRYGAVWLTPKVMSEPTLRPVVPWACIIRDTLPAFSLVM